MIARGFWRRVVADVLDEDIAWVAHARAGYAAGLVVAEATAPTLGRLANRWIIDETRQRIEGEATATLAHGLVSRGVPAARWAITADVSPDGHWVTAVTWQGEVISGHRRAEMIMTGLVLGLAAWRPTTRPARAWDLFA